MIKHIVMWHLKETANSKSKTENAKAIKEQLEALRGKIPGMVTIEVGLDFSQTVDSADIILYSEFESKAALDAYQKHPAHEAVKPLVQEASTKRTVVDCEL
ncbi:Dabb family protein [Oscillospiraceae bacterium CM]|nr:Dabb family protein [Oscillospiraceae bacterium CM]